MKPGPLAKHSHPLLPASWAPTERTSLPSKSLAAEVNNSALRKADPGLLRNLSLSERPSVLPLPAAWRLPPQGLGTGTGRGSVPLPRRSPRRHRAGAFASSHSPPRAPRDSHLGVLSLANSSSEKVTRNMCSTEAFSIFNTEKPHRKPED